MSEGNGQEPGGSERLDRIEKALELILDDHIQFREEHKMCAEVQKGRISTRLKRLGGRPTTS